MSKSYTDLFTDFSSNDWSPIQNDFQPENAFKKFSTEIEKNFEICLSFSNKDEKRHL